MSPPRKRGPEKTGFPLARERRFLVRLAKARLRVADRPAGEVVACRGPRAKAGALLGVVLDERPLSQGRIALAERIPVARAALAFGNPGAAADQEAGQDKEPHVALTDVLMGNSRLTGSRKFGAGDLGLTAARVAAVWQPARTAAPPTRI